MICGEKPIQVQFWKDVGMILIIGRLRISEDKQANLAAFASELIVRERQVSGCLGFDILQDVSDQDSFVMLERWQDRVALNRHLESLDFSHNEEQFGSFLDGEPDWEEYEI
jgi:quinol monooxygenase YgiN